MSIVRLILKEVGGRFQNAAGTIHSKDNMFEGSKNNAPSDKLMGKKPSKGGGSLGESGGFNQDSLIGGSGVGGMGAGDASSGVDFSSMGEVASAIG